MSLLRKLSTQAAEAIQRAYQLGRSDMKRELILLVAPIAGAKLVTSPGRAGRGTVKSVIFRLIQESEGMSSRDVVASARVLGIKDGSTRGTLSALQKERKIEQRNGLWWLTHAEAAE